MKTFLIELKTSLLLTIVFALLLCGVYPLAVWAGAQLFFPRQANGSLVMDINGTVSGSLLLAQNFSSDKYFQPRPSAAGTGYDAANSSGTNLGPTSQKLNDDIKAAIATYRTTNRLPANTAVPADAVTSSGSGLDPDISPTNAGLQASRVAKARNVSPERIRALVAEYTRDRDLGFLGETTVNVLQLNRALDELFPVTPQKLDDDRVHRAFPAS